MNFWNQPMYPLLCFSIATNQLFTAANGSRPNVPKFMIVITDGLSNFPIDTWKQAIAARQAAIQIVSVRVFVWTIRFISAIYKSCFYFIKAIHHICTTLALAHDVFNTLTTSLVQQRLHYENAILYGICQTNLNELPMIEKYSSIPKAVFVILAKSVLFNHPSQSFTGLHHTLHSLPVKDRI